MHTTLLYNHITLRTDECEEDLRLYYVLGEGHLHTVDPLIKTDIRELYKLYVGSTYVLGPHNLVTAFDEVKVIKTSYNIYRINRMLPSAPKAYRFSQKIIMAEVIEAEVLWSNNQLTYYDFIYGD